MLAIVFAKPAVVRRSRVLLSNWQAESIRFRSVANLDVAIGNRHFPIAYSLSADFVPVGDLAEWLCHPLRTGPSLALRIVNTACPLKKDASAKNSGESFADALLCGPSIKFLSTNFRKVVWRSLSH